MKRIITYIVTIILSVLFIYFGNQIASQGMTHFDGTNDTPVESGKVVEILDHTKDEIALSETESYTDENIIFNVQLTSGDHKGDLVKANQNLNTYTTVKLKPVEVGDSLILYNIPDEDLGVNWTLGEYQKTHILIYIGLAFTILLLLFGRIQGFHTIVSLGFTALSIFVVFLPAILSGQNIYLWSIIICIYITLMTFIIISGINRKSITAMIGCFGGLIVAGLLTEFFDLFLRLTGYINENSAYLMYINPDHPIDLKAIIFASIIIGAMGAVMDVAMSISSSLYELSENRPEAKFKELLTSGINIGKDIMGTMANTLVLAYIGSSLTFVLILLASNTSLMDVMNREMVIVEIFQALVGSYGILFTIPLTAIVAGIFYPKYHRKKKADTTAQTANISAK